MEKLTENGLLFQVGHDKKENAHMWFFNRSSIRSDENGWQRLIGLAIAGVGAMIALYWLSALVMHWQYVTVSWVVSLFCIASGIAGIAATLIMALTLWFEICPIFTVGFEMAIAANTKNKHLLIPWGLVGLGIILADIWNLYGQFNPQRPISISNFWLVVATAFIYVFGYSAMLSPSRMMRMLAEREAQDKAKREAAVAVAMLGLLPLLGRGHGVMVVGCCGRRPDDAPADTPEGELHDEEPEPAEAEPEPEAPAAPERSREVADAEDREAKALGALVERLGVAARAPEAVATGATTPAQEE
ncbi:MAG: hypothetical protein WC516_07525 [Patescibacteria group bacterium]